MFFERDQPTGERLPDERDSLGAGLGREHHLGAGERSQGGFRQPPVGLGDPAVAVQSRAHQLAALRVEQSERDRVAVQHAHTLCVALEGALLLEHVKRYVRVARQVAAPG